MVSEIPATQYDTLLLYLPWDFSSFTNKSSSSCSLTLVLVELELSNYRLLKVAKEARIGPLQWWEERSGVACGACGGCDTDQPPVVPVLEGLTSKYANRISFFGSRVPGIARSHVLIYFQIG